LGARLAFYFGIGMTGGLAILWLWPKNWSIGSLDPS
jgi:hypothetical protein